MNVDITELQKFNSLANEWWNESGQFHSLHELNPVRLNWIESHTSLLNKKIVDIGCGGGILSESMAKKGAEVTGVDMADNVINIAESHRLESGLSIRYLVSPIEDFSEREAGLYDIVTCMEMLEHVPDPLSVIQACARLLKPGGIVFFSTLNRNIKSFFYAIVGAEYILRLLPTGTHDHSRFITPSELSRYVRETNMSVISIAGISCNLLGKNFRLSKNTDINYLLACTRDN